MLRIYNIKLTNGHLQMPDYLFVLNFKWKKQANCLFAFIFIPGYLLFKDFCENVSEEPVPHLKFYEEVRLLNYGKLENINQILLENCEQKTSISFFFNAFYETTASHIHTHA